MRPLDLIIEHVTGYAPVDRIVDQPVFSDEQQQRINDLWARVQSGEPLQYVLGEAPFLDLMLKVTPDVLIPRPETEILVDHIISLWSHSSQNASILDLGTGSGNIAIALAKHLPLAKITAIDTCPRALKIAEENAVNHAVADRIHFVHEDMKIWLNEQACHYCFDVVVSNPPYIKHSDLATLPKDVRQEPVLALNGGEDGLDFYRVMLKYFDQIVTPTGIWAVEVGDDQADCVWDLVKGVEKAVRVEVIKDYVGVDRFVIAHCCST
jgi:release factor glutamine methyltransferase